MAEIWLDDVRKYAADADEGVVDAIVRYCGIALHDRDSSLVAFSDPQETNLVRENYLKRKLGLTQDDAALDAGIASVGQRMSGDRTKNRVTVYYLLAELFDRLTEFGSSSPGVAGVAGVVVGAAAMSQAPAPTAPLAAAAMPPARSQVPPAAIARRGDNPWALAYGAAPEGFDLATIALWGAGGVTLAAFLAIALFNIRHPSAAPPYVAAVAPTVLVAVPAPVAVIPDGAGVSAAMRDGTPMLSVYFDTGKSDVTAQFAAAAAPVKAHLDANPQAHLAVSGFNDPTGNAAANAVLSKNRAQKVKAALEALGVPADRVLLEKPAETTATGADNAGSRRVDVVVKE